MNDSTTPPRYPTIRVNLLHAHGSPTGYLYRQRGCRCVACRGQHSALGAAHYAAHRAQKAAYCAAHRGEREAKRRSRVYGIGPGEWEAIFAAQGNSCAICGTVKPGGKHGQWNIDHDHKTGKVRGVLCHQHNIGLGNFNDDPQLLMVAIEYLAAAYPDASDTSVLTASATA